MDRNYIIYNNHPFHAYLAFGVWQEKCRRLNLQHLLAFSPSVITFIFYPPSPSNLPIIEEILGL